jgi:hypothetical protein
MPLSHVRAARARSGRISKALGLGSLRIELTLEKPDELVLRGVLDPHPLALAINDAVALYSGGPVHGRPHDDETIV